MRALGLATLAAALALLGCAGAKADDGGPAVRVAAAADLRLAMDELVEAWAAANPDRRVEVVYGSSGTFFAQISEGAPFDLYFSADAEYPRQIERAGLAEPGSTRLYAVGQLAAWVPAASPIDVGGRGLAALADPAVARVAIANPEHAPYGRAAVAALRAAGLYDALEPKLVLGENVSQAAQFVASGNADAGIIALSLALGPPLVDAGRFVIVPLDAYPRIEQGAVVLSTARDPDAARAFLELVLGADGRAILDRHGFLPPDS